MRAIVQIGAFSSSCLVFVILCVTTTLVSARTVARVSVDSNGSEANGGFSLHPSISGDGRFVAFTSMATDLVPNDTNGVSDIFVHDRQTGSTTRVSVDSDGNEANSNSLRPSLSGNGRMVAFVSSATNLVFGDTNNVSDIFVHDRQTGSTTRVSLDSEGNQANAGSGFPTISSNGRFVAFASAATNLVPGDTNGFTDIFVHDRETAIIDRVSVDSDGNQANFFSGVFDFPSLSSEGRFVAFRSGASNLIVADTNNLFDIFVRDRQTGTTTRVSVDSDGNEVQTFATNNPNISADGRFVAFRSAAATLVGDDTNGVPDVFVHDRQTGQTARVSLDSANLEADAVSGHPRLSADGRFVCFLSDATNLVPGDTNSSTDVFVHDRLTGNTARVNLNSDGNEADQNSLRGSISADGRIVAFSSAATNLVPDDSNSVSDIFVAENSLAVVIVDIDIKPGSFPNTINLGSGGNVPVAVISTATFDATTVDPASVTLSSAPAKMKGNGSANANHEDVNGDGLPDLVVHIATEALELTDEDTEAVLEGVTFAGQAVRGADTIRVVP